MKHHPPKNCHPNVKRAPSAQRRVGILLRTSTATNEAAKVLAADEARCRDYTASKGFDVATVYGLHGVSGNNTPEHVEMQRMIADVRAGRIHVLVVPRLNHLSRNSKHLAELMDILQQNHVDFVSLAEQIDTSTSIGMTTWVNILHAIVRWEGEQLSVRNRLRRKPKENNGADKGPDQLTTRRVRLSLSNAKR